ncbi:Asp-tRNA(Asn)/Glu-tRNA(Gln) amidotransferase subunit GatB [Fluviispira sanaruensis]|uniref:Aspartyl/glutamyl-tRNA(Asn/Gln) amidotransferase subunit B n=1 Tax=Fluviispira sanaruensis TaxID=2493639 RepID=A0A4P2VHQ9_FLUSA|nr:Asp-tRNA(Asn)/Glu-tRNA(Gln) amidotransferase subunit GatB [Fluviispira sanaruensis]BBH52533.1 Asp-tRNA(Asn)/Glu-tRNA(Gln) amidotransferase subunit GatB [Fluviispira sanaruensis]
MSENNLTSYPKVLEIMKKYDVVIGIEVHCQLATKSKMFSHAKNAYGDSPNSNIDPTCLGLPGALPTINEECVNLAIRMGLALKSNIQPVSVFARKNYFYPDLPKGYQITQYDKPICFGGELFLTSGKKVNIERVQIEEDAGKNIHVGATSLVDYNRSGVGLIEIVSAPDMTSPEEASDYLRKLHSYVVNLDISDGDLERGNFRADANVSIKPKGSNVLGQRCEIKNVNSFKYLEKAIAYEVERQYEVIESGGTIHMETRGYDSDKNVTIGQRSKESAKDYRYFPEPDLPPLVVSIERIEKVRSQMPELPESKAARFIDKYALPEYDAKVITSSRINSAYFESLVNSLLGKVEPKNISNYFMTDVMRASKVFAEEKGISLDELQQVPVSLENSIALLSLQASGTISGRIAKEIFEEMILSGKSPVEIVKEKNLIQISDETSIVKICEQVILENPEQLSQYLSGKEKLFGFFVGQTMKISGGKLNPSKVNEMLKKLLDSKK